ncbi:MAG TPA: C-terminal binding protein [Pirellulales bacterium]|jgi:D-3-phosphoglycerate dehydrogenase|nr:C-terminal binding protein [Pirellulales bacterium]
MAQKPPQFRVLLTDYAWPDVSIERKTLAAVDAELIVADKTDADSLAALALKHEVDAIMTNWAKVPGTVIGASPKVRIVSRLGIGLDNIDVEYCTAHGIPVTNVPDYCLIEVAEHALALMMTLARKVALYHAATKAGRYELQAGSKLRRIEGQTLGIVGYGNIGRVLAKKAKCLGMKVLATCRSPKDETGVTFCSLDELLIESDYVSLHVPATAETRGLMNADNLKLMKPTAYLINTARGAIVDEQALATAIENGQLAGAALDVQQKEPCDLSQPPFNDPRVIVTPHAAFVSEESLENLRRRTAQQVADRLQGREPENVVNGII